MALLSSDIPDIDSIRGSLPTDSTNLDVDVPDVDAARAAKDTVPEGYEDHPQMKAQDVGVLTKASDFISDVGDQIKYNDSFNSLQNMWRSLMNSRKVAVPITNEQGKFMGTRLENDKEHRERIKSNTEAKRNNLHDNLAAEITAKVAQIAVDPMNWLPIGQTYKKVAGIMGATTAVDAAIYQLVEDGEIDAGDVAIAGAFGAILGTSFKYVGGKVIDAYKALRAENVPHKEAMQQALPPPEVLKALPAPQKKLPAPAEKTLNLPAPKQPLALPAPKDSVAPYFVTKKGRVVTKPTDTGGVTRIFEGTGSTGKASQMEAMWQERAIKSWGDTNTPVASVTSKTVREQADLVRKQNSDIRVFSDSAHPDSVMLPAFERAATKQEEGVQQLKKHLNQGGNISQSLMHHIASTSLGTAIGGALGGEEGAIAGAMSGLSAPLAFRYMRKGIGKLNEWADTDGAAVIAHSKILNSPASVLKSFGETGRMLAEKIEKMHNNVDLALGDKLWRFEQNVGNLSKVDLTDAMRLLQHSIKPAQASKAALKAAKELRREFNSVLDDAVDAGIMTTKQVSALKLAASKNGYFPRIYDKDFLASKEGKQQWIDTWTNMSKSKSDMSNTLMAILGEKDMVADFVRKAQKNHKGEYYLSQGNALDLLRLMQNRSHHARSSHLEKARKIKVKDEAILAPFLVKDPAVVISRYFGDAYRRIEAAKIFDGVDSTGKIKQDYHADIAFNKITKELSGEEAKLARDIYYTSVGDLQSSVIKSAMDMSDTQRKVLQGVSSFETATKLSTAQMLNMLQATINGMTRLLGQTGNPLTSLKLYSKGLVMAASKEGGDFAQRSGAAIETTIMEIAGEGSKVGKYGERVLKYTGFIAAEKMQRRLGANIGRAYAEDLLSKYAKIQKGTIKGKKADKILRQMKELHLPTNRVANETDMHRAGLRFSNDINFRNTPDRIPLGWQTPYGRLFSKFKSFAFHQSAFVRDNVIKPLIKGNPYPLIWYAGAGGSLGMGVDELRRMVKGDDREFTMTERYLRGITSIGGMGLIQDVISNAHRSPEKLVAGLGGAGLGDAARIITAATHVVTGDPQKALDEIQRMFVLPAKGYIIDELANEGYKRSSSRGSTRSFSRGSSR